MVHLALELWIFPLPDKILTTLACQRVVLLAKIFPLEWILDLLKSKCGSAFLLWAKHLRLEGIRHQLLLLRCLIGLSFDDLDALLFLKTSFRESVLQIVFNQISNSHLAVYSTEHSWDLSRLDIAWYWLSLLLHFKRWNDGIEIRNSLFFHQFLDLIDINGNFIQPNPLSHCYGLWERL